MPHTGHKELCAPYEAQPQTDCSTPSLWLQCAITATAALDKGDSGTLLSAAAGIAQLNH